MPIRLIIGSVVALAAVLTGTGAVAGARTEDSLSGLRAATNQFHSVATAEQHGYALLTDAKGIACIDMPSMPGMPGGGMGVHWANSAIVGDPAIVANHPEAMVYAPRPDGTLQLAAVEYVVIKSAWDASHRHPPTLFGHRFNVTDTPNRFGLPAFYSLHVWAWKQNPVGTFQMWNPNVTCPS
jgi:hypothetical protein